MPKRASTLTGAAGEHFVAFILSARGYAVGLTRGGSPTIDLLTGGRQSQFKSKHLIGLGVNIQGTPRITTGNGMSAARHLISAVILFSMHSSI
jgi:hypothetical protein